MPYVSILEPQVLMGVVEKLAAQEQLTLINKFPKRSWPYPTATWDVIKSSRMVAKPNVANSEAHIVPRLGRFTQTASFLYMRDKKVFEPTTLHWIREPGQMAAINAEREIAREVTDMNRRFDNFVEMALWGALAGELHFQYRDVVADVDYSLPASHKITPSTSWTTATPAQILGNIRAWKKLILRDSRVPAQDVYASEETLNLIVDSFTRTTISATQGQAAILLSDRMRDSYYSTGTIPGFMSLNWNLTSAVYEEDDGDLVDFVPTGKLFMGNYTDNQPIEVMEGPTADHEAPNGYTGRFMKTWQDADPSARQILLEYHFLPVVSRPEQFLVASVA